MNRNLRRWLTAVVVALVAVPVLVMADKNFKPNQELGAWRQTLPEGFIKSITVEVQRTQGRAKDTFLNAAFGDDLAFEGAARKYLTSDQPMKITWVVNGKPNGKEVRILCHHGKCQLKTVFVDYKED